jgi:hypothetical protein
MSFRAAQQVGRIHMLSSRRSHAGSSCHAAASVARLSTCDHQLHNFIAQSFSASAQVFQHFPKRMSLALNCNYSKHEDRIRKTLYTIQSPRRNVCTFQPSPQ